MKSYVFKILLLFSFIALAQPQPGYWQQQVDYTMEVTMDVKTYQYSGTQHIQYTNNSPDTLYKVFIHLYYNAFQPNSEMDVRLQNISDPDSRMVKTFKKLDNSKTYESKIKTLKPNEIGYLNILTITQNQIPLTPNVHETIAEVALAEPLLPHQKTTLNLTFQGQVPVMVRRAGRNSAEGVALSMAQWYPKMVEYDFEGWHPDPYIGREFHSIWGNFDVKITLDKNYTIGGTGYLQNANQIGKGYQDQGIDVVYPKKTKTLTWHFIAPNVLDFTWAADPDYIHDRLVTENGTTLHFLYKNNKEYIDNWKKFQPKAAELLQFYNTHIGNYPYKQYSIIQGGDGGMEYAMCTLITGNRRYPSLVGLTAHEMAHAWFQHTLAFNEGKHCWMDEGFTSYVSDWAMNQVMPPKEAPTNIFEDSYKSYYSLVKSGKEQPLTTHADRYDVNQSYGISAYSKGSIFLSQLGYIIGEENLKKTLKRFYSDFKFTHPTPNDFKRTAEKISGAILDWYLVDFTQTTNNVDYAITTVTSNTDKSRITLQRIGRTPMPLDIQVIYTNNEKEYYHIPNPLMRCAKSNPYPSYKWTVLNGWDWGKPVYEFEISQQNRTIKSIVIDPSGFMADVNREDNTYVPKNN